MRCFDRNRKRLTKKQFVRGTLTSSNGENEATIEDSAGLPFESMEISGKTRQATYEGINLFDQELLVSNNSFIKSSFNGIECLKSRNNGLISMPFEVPAGTYKFSFDVAHPTGYDVYSYIHMEDGSRAVILIYGTKDDALSEFTRKANTIKAVSKIVQIEIGIWNGAKPIYLKDIMLCAGDETVYEPYVGGTYSPNPDYPQPIENANGEGVSVVLHGYNLFNKDTVTFRKNLNVNTGTLYNSATRGVSDYIEVDASKQYTIFRPYQPSTNAVRYGCCYDANFGYLGELVRVSGNNVSGYATYNLHTGTEYVRLNFWYDAENSINESEGLIFYEGTEELPYEPYFREEIAIPSTVNDTPLLFTEWDKLTVDRVANKVIYTEGSYVKVFKGTEHFFKSNYCENNGYGRLFQHVISDFYLEAGGYCSHFAYKPYAPPKVSKNVFGYSVTREDASTIYFKTDGDMTNPFEDDMVEFKARLKEQYDAGAPVTVVAQRKTAKEHDITRTDFGQSLLNLMLPRTQSGIFTVESPIGVGGVSVEYYSMEKEDKVTLEVLCMTEAGEELKRTSNSVRRGTKYLATAPEIDGYIPMSESIFGVASADAQIIFEYTEAGTEVG